MTVSVHRTAWGLRWDPKAPWPPPLSSHKAHISPKGLGQPRLAAGQEYSSEGQSPQGKEGEGGRVSGGEATPCRQEGGRGGHQHRGVKGEPCYNGALRVSPTQDGLAK